MSTTSRDEFLALAGSLYDRAILCNNATASARTGLILAGNLPHGQDARTLLGDLDFDRRVEQLELGRERV